jgi:hypothetical protein
VVEQSQQFIFSLIQIMKLYINNIIDICRICGTEGETIEHIISSCTVLAQSEYKKRHDILQKLYT